mmetsp:Transcript_12842/g.30107  ORF Transcript_12842/g.30107 Transcript_12842/m.30107 type:complete len:559 (+) Transcript_12842:162-1838(+)
MGCGVSRGHSRVLPETRLSSGVVKTTWTVRDPSSRRNRPQFTGSQDPAHLAKLRILRKVDLFRLLSAPQQDDIIQSAEDAVYADGDTITLQGEISRTFFAIKSGEVEVLINGERVRSLARGNFFGERALLIDEPAMSTAKAVNGEVKLWYLDRETFMFVVHGQMMQQMLYTVLLQDLSITLDGLETKGPLGTGAYGQVDMVECRRTGLQYALKTCKKGGDGVVPPQLEQEVELLRVTDHPLHMKLVKTFESKDHFYILTELITGCQLHAAMRMIPKAMSRAQAQFYVGSIVLAIEALHVKRILYRDLKPENIMLDAQGYVKIVDFGTAKQLPVGKNRTFTVIGTPHYMAPEVVRRRGYSFGVDLWAIGIILFELTCGYLPFGNSLDDPDATCKAAMQEPLLFPLQYTDDDGKDLIANLLCKNPVNRLGNGMMGFEDVKSADWFVMIDAADTEADSEKDLFSLITGRELMAPIMVDGVGSMKRNNMPLRHSRSSLSVGSSMMTKSLRMESVASRRSMESARLSMDPRRSAEMMVSSTGTRPWLAVKTLPTPAPPPEEVA